MNDIVETRDQRLDGPVGGLLATLVALALMLFI